MITIKKEPIKDTLQELIPLLSEHHDEVEDYKEKIAFNPDYMRYLEMEKSGLIHSVIVRDEGKIIGYCISFLMTHLHHSDHVYAMNDIVYLMPEYRRSEIGRAMFTFVEDDLKHMGVSVFIIHMKTKQPFEGLMQSLGFDRVEINYSKYIGEQ